MRPGGTRHQAQDRVAVTLLPQPDLPTSPSVRPFEMQGHAVDGMNQSRLGVETDFQIFNIKQRQRNRYPPLVLRTLHPAANFFFTP